MDLCIFVDINIFIEKMNHISVTSLQDFKEQLKSNPDLFLLIYKKGSEQSDCALTNLDAMKPENASPVFSVNVAEVRDVHPEYNITSAPTLIEFKRGVPARYLKGCHQEGALEAFFNPLSITGNAEGEKKQKQVIVYSTPTCSWCRTLKDYLKNNQIQFRDIDVSKDEKAATEMVKRSGQQGVPQSLIDGQVVVGFDRNRINSLLGINA
ncbi:glutaredoxin domain-containing protein [Marinilabilia salmonicolor]|jgi:glutaredoxin-like YruB-family protein|uniref:Glutaredoxin-like YruB-family protein n=1 Tax=Marinilabilia salmonicolor TaxID=989 RepID=A0A368V645_9BACT|nr:glutaredoxin domain-containing protein [Marinilabilia salmonicolor]RCW36578.1 glutaredoxin-like YruB-family protein [Marinilabilia salmonicolor]